MPNSKFQIVSFQRIKAQGFPGKKWVIATLVGIFLVGLFAVYPQTTQAIDCSAVPKGPQACNIRNPGIPSRAPGDPVTFLTSGCGYHNGDLTMPCWHSLAGMVAVLITVTDFILGIVGALALLMFVWGGFQWLMSAGEEERVKAGTTTLRNALIGLLIVFSSWIGVNFIVSTLTGKTGLFGNAANTWYSLNYDHFCYRPLTAEELECQLAKPYQPVAPTPSAPAPSGPACDSPKVLRSGPSSGETCIDVCRRAMADTTVVYPGGHGGDIGTMSTIVESMPAGVRSPEAYCCCGFKKGPQPGESCEPVPGLAGVCGFGLKCNVSTIKCEASASISAP